MREWRFRYLKEPLKARTFNLDDPIETSAKLAEKDYIEIKVISDTYDRAKALADDIIYRRGHYGTKTRD